MERKDYIRRILAGVFFVSGIALIAVVILGIGLQKGLTQPKFEMSVLFREVGGLSVGARVALSGVNVGIVHSIDFLEEEIEGRGVKVVLRVFEKYKRQIEKTSRVVIKTEGVLGEKLIEMNRSPEGSRIDLSKPLIGEDPLDVQDLAKLFGDTAEALKETTDSINYIVSEMRRISATTKRLLNRIEQRVIDGNLFKVF